MLYHGAWTMTLNLDVYKNTRADVIANLGDKAKEFVLEIEIERGPRDAPQPSPKIRFSSSLVSSGLTGKWVCSSAAIC